MCSRFSVKVSYKIDFTACTLHRDHPLISLMLTIFFSHFFVKTKFFKGLVFRRSKIGIFQKMRIKNLREEGSRSDLKNLAPSPWKRRKTTSSATFCATYQIYSNFDNLPFCVIQFNLKSSLWVCKTWLS